MREVVVTIEILMLLASGYLMSSALRTYKQYKNRRK
jgi:hypothetical protein